MTKEYQKPALHEAWGKVRDALAPVLNDLDAVASESEQTGEYQEQDLIKGLSALRTLAGGMLTEYSTAQAFALPTADIWKAPPKPMQWLVKDWLPAGRIALLTGEGGRGKSRLALMLAAGIASEGNEWLPGGTALDNTSPSSVVLASWEDDRDTVRRRLNDWPMADGGKRRGDKRKTLPALLADRLAFLDLAGSGPLWAPEENGSRHTSTMGALTEVGHRVRAFCEETSASLLVVDPLAAAFACNENDRGLVRHFMSDWDGWARETGCTVLILAHPSKSHTDYSGSTDWHAAARAIWTLGLVEAPDKRKLTQLCCLKSSYSKTPKPLQLTNWHWWKAEAWPDQDNVSNVKRSAPRRLEDIPAEDT